MPQSECQRVFTSWPLNFKFQWPLLQQMALLSLFRTVCWISTWPLWDGKMGPKFHQKGLTEFISNKLMIGSNFEKSTGFWARNTRVGILAPSLFNSGTSTLAFLCQMEVMLLCPDTYCSPNNHMPHILSPFTVRWPHRSSSSWRETFLFWNGVHFPAGEGGFSFHLGAREVKCSRTSCWPHLSEKSPFAVLSLWNFCDNFFCSLCWLIWMPSSKAAARKLGL